MSGQEKRNVVAIIQARMGSQRLPGKVLLDIHGKPMLARVLERATNCPSVDKTVIATTWESEDNPVVEWGRRHDFGVVRGHPTDVLDRFHQAAEEVEADVVVRITGDCPLLDPVVSERTIQRFLKADPSLDFVANRLPDHRTYPIGLDTEVCSREALQRAWQEAKEPHQREHVMPYLYENSSFEIALVDADMDMGNERWTVDTQEDLEFVRAVYEAFAPRDQFGWTEVLDLLESKPQLREINRGVEHRSLKDIDQRFSSARSEESRS